MRIRIGTSGWNYAHWRNGVFYPEGLPAGQEFAYYAERFDCVELNTTFYGLPRPETSAAWREKAPPGFVFAAKGSRYLSHLKRLLEPEEGIQRFFDAVSPLGDALGPVFFQLPPRMRPDMERLDYFLAALPPGHHYAFEFRDTSWHTQETYALLRSYGAAFCIWDLQGVTSAIEATADWTYVRLHGPTARKYADAYGPALLRVWAERIRALPVEEAWVFFDNDGSGHAVRDAMLLREMLY